MFTTLIVRIIIADNCRMAGITNGQLFEWWQGQTDISPAASTKTIAFLFNKVRSELGSAWPAENKPFEKTLLAKVRGFCTTLKAKWRKANRGRERFQRKNASWLASSFNIVLPEMRSSTPSMSTVGRPKKLFSELSERSKSRAVQSLKATTSKEEILHATKSLLRDEGKRAAADVVKLATEYSPTRPIVMRKLFKESLSPSTKQVIPYSEDAALALFLNANLTKDAYHQIRIGSKKHNASNLYPSYDRIRSAKKRCYPSEITVTEHGKQ